MKKKQQISVSLLDCAPENFFSIAFDLKKAGAHSLHIDIMDGSFTSFQKTYACPVLSTLKTRSALGLEAHLMVRHPEHFVSPFFDAVTFHPWTCRDVDSFFETLDHKKMRAGLAIDLDEPYALWPAHWFERAHEVLIMGVKAGRGGQPFQERTALVLEDFKSRWPHLCLSIDGGMNDQTIKKVSQADKIIAGSFILNHPQGLACAI